MLINKILLLTSMALVLSGCQWLRKDVTPTPTVTHTPTITQTVTPTPPTITYWPMCTPPLCAIGTSEVYFCSETCPNGCGTTCATYTPTPESDERYIQTDGGFSFIPPSGWEIVNYPNLKYKVARGPLLGTFPIYISFVDEASSNSLDEYVTDSLSALTQAFEDARVIAREEFFTTDGRRGVKVIVENKQVSAELVQVFYFFETGAMKFVATFSRTAGLGQEYDALVDQCAKTFRLED